MPPPLTFEKLIHCIHLHPPLHFGNTQFAPLATFSACNTHSGGDRGRGRDRGGEGGREVGSRGRDRGWGRGWDRGGEGCGTGVGKGVGQLLPFLSLTSISTHV